MEEWAWLVRSLGHKYGLTDEAAAAAAAAAAAGDHDHVVLLGNQDSRLECMALNGAEESTALSTGGTTPRRDHAEICQQQQQQQQEREAVPCSPMSVLRDVPFSSTTSSSSVHAQIVSPSRTELINLLADSGLPCLVSLLQDEDQLSETLLTLLRDRGRREALVQDLVQQLEELRKRDKQSSAYCSKLEGDIQLSRRKLALQEQRHAMALSSTNTANAVLRKEFQSLEAANLNLQQRCSQLEHNCRAKERAAERYQHKLLDLLGKEEGQRSTSSTGKHVNNKQKTALASEVCALRARVAQLACHESFIPGKAPQHKHVPLHVLEQLCKKLGVKSPIQLPTAVDALLVVNAAVPLLEQFVEEVCGVVLVSGKQHLPSGAAGNPREVPHILKSWLKLLPAELEEVASWNQRNS